MERMLSAWMMVWVSLSVVGAEGALAADRQSAVRCPAKETLTLKRKSEFDQGVHYEFIKERGRVTKLRVLEIDSRSRLAGVLKKGDILRLRNSREMSAGEMKKAWAREGTACLEISRGLERRHLNLAISRKGVPVADRVISGAMDQDR